MDRDVTVFIYCPSVLSESRQSSRYLPTSRMNVFTNDLSSLAVGRSVSPLTIRGARLSHLQHRPLSPKSGRRVFAATWLPFPKALSPFGSPPGCYGAGDREACHWPGRHHPQSALIQIALDMGQRCRLKVPSTGAVQRAPTEPRQRRHQSTPETPGSPANEEINLDLRARARTAQHNKRDGLSLVRKQSAPNLD